MRKILQKKRGEARVDQGGDTKVKMRNQGKTVSTNIVARLTSQEEAVRIGVEVRKPKREKEVVKERTRKGWRSLKVTNNRKLRKKK